MSVEAWWHSLALGGSLLVLVFGTRWLDRQMFASAKAKISAVGPLPKFRYLAVRSEVSGYLQVSNGEKIMKQEIKGEHYKDENDNPAGGDTTGTGIQIRWQDGPLGRGPDKKEPNGAFVEGVIEAAADRLRFYQRSKFACADNAEALEYLVKAQECLNRRTLNREAREVEGTNNA